MSSYLDKDIFAAYLRARRGDMGLRDAANQIGNTSAPTLSRIENGKTPDLETFLRLCDWIGVPFDTFLKRSDEVLPDASTPEIIEAHLRADRELDPKLAHAIAQVVKSAYKLNQRAQDADE